MLYFKKIPLLPSHWKLDVIVCEDLEHRKQYMEEIYGWSADAWDDLSNDCVTLIYGKKGSGMENKSRILLNLANVKDKHIMVHELTHVMFYASKHIGFETTHDSQEWCACFMEMLWSELCKTNFEKIKPKTIKP